MACDNELQLFAANEQLATHAAQLVIAEVKRIEVKYSRYREDSVTTRINQDIKTCSSSVLQTSTQAVDQCFPRTVADVNFYRTTFYAMACDNELQLFAANEQLATHAAQLVIAEVKRIEVKYSRLSRRQRHDAHQSGRASGRVPSTTRPHCCSDMQMHVFASAVASLM